MGKMNGLGEDVNAHQKTAKADFGIYRMWESL